MATTKYHRLFDDGMVGIAYDFPPPRNSVSVIAVIAITTTKAGKVTVKVLPTTKKGKR